MIQVDAQSSKELQAAILAMKFADADLRKEIYNRTRQAILPDWSQGIADKVMEFRNNAFNSRMLLKSVRVAVTTQSISLLAATSTRPNVSGGLIPAKHFHLAEYGFHAYEKDIKGRRGATKYNYKRTIGTQFAPRRRSGYILGDVANKIVYRSVSLWIQTVVRTFYEAVEGGK